MRGHPPSFSRIFQAFWGLVTMLFLLFGAWCSTPGSGSFLSAVALELHDDENWVFFSGWVDEWLDEWPCEVVGANSFSRETKGQAPIVGY